jgi:uncharacterized protein
VPGAVVLVGIGLAAGFFSGLFGVGGGILIVPALIAFAGYRAKPATATSLAAILFTASAAALAHAQSDNVEWGYALLVGLPAVAGATAGTALQQRLHPRRLVVAFAVLLLVVAARLAL